MSLPTLLAVILGMSLTLYALLAGADFGAGILDLLAGDRPSDRASIAAAIGPVWEANHVWLIFSITILFSAFPVAFSALGTALLAPLTIALVTIVLRGAALGLRSAHEAKTPAYARLGRLFGAASLVAPLAFGAVAGGLAAISSTDTTKRASTPAVPWTGLFAVTVGLLAAALCAQLATSFLTLRLARGRRIDVEAEERFRRRGLVSGAAVLVLSVAALGVASSSAPALADRLTGAALPLVVVTFASLALSLAAFATRRYGVARTATLVGGAALLWGWFVAQTPHLIGTRLTIQAAAATHPALIAISIALGVVLLAVLPATYLLFGVFARSVPEVIE